MHTKTVNYAAHTEKCSKISTQGIKVLLINYSQSDQSIDQFKGSTY